MKDAIMDVTKRPNDGSRLCPMCGELVAAVYKQCPACGEPLLPLQPVVNRRDQGLALGIGGLSVAISGYFIWQAIDAMAWMSHPLRGPHAAMDRDLAMISAVLVTIWLWGLPFLAIAIGDPRQTKKGLPVSRWKIFWQTQAIMYALSIGLSILCFGVCTQFGR